MCPNQRGLLRSIYVPQFHIEINPLIAKTWETTLLYAASSDCRVTTGTLIRGKRCEPLLAAAVMIRVEKILPTRWQRANTVKKVLSSLNRTTSRSWKINIYRNVNTVSIVTASDDTYVSISKILCRFLLIYIQKQFKNPILFPFTLERETSICTFWNWTFDGFVRNMCRMFHREQRSNFLKGKVSDPSYFLKR